MPKNTDHYIELAIKILMPPNGIIILKMLLFYNMLMTPLIILNVIKWDFICP